MRFERDVLRRDRRRRLWPSLFVFVLVYWVVAHVFFTSSAPPEPHIAHHMIERQTLTDPRLQDAPPLLKDSPPLLKDAPPRLNPIPTTRRVLKTLLQDNVLSPTSNSTLDEFFGDDLDKEAAEKLTELSKWMTARPVEFASCKKDTSLDPISNRYKGIFLASNLKDNAQILPNMIKHLMLLILENPDVKFFVSIYESGSKDHTPDILKAFDDVLEVLDIEHDIQYNGRLKRQPKQGRIEFLSIVRNAAIRPLITDPRGYRWDRILFINDVVVCSDDLHRLLMHDADIVCGLDFVKHVTRRHRIRHHHQQPDEIRRRYYSERLNDIVQEATKVLPSARRWEKPTEVTTMNLAEDQKSITDTWLDFYDIWVSHDLSGHHFVNNEPFVENNSYAHHRLRQGLPFPVECCWNGAAVLNPEPFLRKGVQFRSALPEECRTSECVLLCHDFQRLGYNRAIVDPGVQLTYSYYDARILEIAGMKGIGRVDWKTVKSSDPMIDERFPFNRSVDCCNIIKHKDIVDFKRCKQNYNFWNVSSALKHLGLIEEKSESIWNTTME